MKLKLQGTFQSRSDVAGLLNAPGEAALIERGRPRLLVLRCPCGCGEEYSINLDPQAGKAWRIYQRDKKLTIYPSVWRDNACEAHYIIWRDSIFVFGQKTLDDDSPDVETSSDRVLAAFGSNHWTSYVTVADSMGEIPWDVLEICRRLARNGLLVEGTATLKGSFQRSAP